ncbi:unnamed protein product [Cylicocyclus nassatus]|uniref:Uncharacterized protein n=1 Tax=Cylicocyclus nassatus TaxID=53992 RepID=A0AA36GYW3_CYLNA|nr:unnamed protein product [Cylicocyclus nassatus]
MIVTIVKNFKEIRCMKDRRKLLDEVNDYLQATQAISGRNLEGHDEFMQKFCKRFIDRLKGENIATFIVLAAWFFAAIGGFVFACCKGNCAAILSIMVLIAAGVPYIKDTLGKFLGS